MGQVKYFESIHNEGKCSFKTVLRHVIDILEAYKLQRRMQALIHVRDPKGKNLRKIYKY